MKLFKIRLALFLTIVIICSSCKNNVLEDDDSNYACTDNFETIYITVSKYKLDNYQTIRLETGDTLPKNIYSSVFDNKYPVIDDSYKKLLRNRVEKFRFQGFVGDSLVVNEDFEVSADACHIFYKSGKLIVD